jgi:hypothetical protein
VLPPTWAGAGLPLSVFLGDGCLLWCARASAIRFVWAWFDDAAAAVVAVLPLLLVAVALDASGCGVRLATEAVAGIAASEASVSSLLLLLLLAKNRERFDRANRSVICSFLDLLWPLVFPPAAVADADEKLDDDETVRETAAPGAVANCGFGAGSGFCGCCCCCVPRRPWLPAEAAAADPPCPTALTEEEAVACGFGAAAEAVGRISTPPPRSSSMINDGQRRADGLDGGGGGLTVTKPGHKSVCFVLVRHQAVGPGSNIEKLRLRDFSW